MISIDSSHFIRIHKPWFKAILGGVRQVLHQLWQGGWFPINFRATTLEQIIKNPPIHLQLMFV